MPTTKWFGPQPWGAICLFSERIDIPVGDNCEWCDEEFVADDRGVAIPMEFRPWHSECFLRSIFGSTGHQLDQCECNNITDISETGMTRRQAAVASVALFRQRIRDGIVPVLSRPESVN